MSDVLEIDATTGAKIERDFTAEESAQREIDAAADTAAKAQAEKTAQTQTKIRDAAIAHAKSLGFTDEMISVMYPTLVEE